MSKITNHVWKLISVYTLNFKKENPNYIVELIFAFSFWHDGSNSNWMWLLSIEKNHELYST